jgi:hypothetical protein
VAYQILRRRIRAGASLRPDVQRHRALDGTGAKPRCFFSNDALYRFGDVALRGCITRRFQ